MNSIIYSRKYLYVCLVNFCCCNNQRPGYLINRHFFTHVVWMLEVHGQDASKFSSWQTPNFSLSSHCVPTWKSKRGSELPFLGLFLWGCKTNHHSPTSRVFLGLITFYNLCLPTLSHSGSTYPHINCQEHPYPKSVRPSLLICCPSQPTEGLQILSFTFHNQFHKVYQRSNHLQFLEIGSYFFKRINNCWVLIFKVVDILWKLLALIFNPRKDSRITHLYNFF